MIGWMMTTLRSPFQFPLMLALTASVSAPASASGVAVYVIDDALLPIMIGEKARTDLELGLSGGPLQVLDDRTWNHRLGDAALPFCEISEDTCWRGIAEQLSLDRLLVLEVFADGAEETARVRVFEPVMAGLPAPIFEGVLPSGGGFPIELAVTLKTMPLYVPPPPPVEPKKGLLARLFKR